jgi:alpha-L-rhamnosidase
MNHKAKKYTSLNRIAPGWLLIIIVTLSFSCTKSTQSEPPLMKKALPVWADGREREMNLTLCFQGVFEAKESKETGLKITGSTLYRVFLNGEFLGYGPARAAHGWFRVDEYDLTQKVRPGKNLLAVEVAGYNSNSYYTLDQPSFLQAEIVSGEQVLLATGQDSGFRAFEPGERLQKTERYSFQRPFSEYYRLGPESGQWKTGAAEHNTPLALAIQPEVRLLPRNVLYPEYNIVRPAALHSRGTIRLVQPGNYRKDRSLTRISETLKGFPESELEVLPSQLIQEITNDTQELLNTPWISEPISLKENEFMTFDFGINLSGFIGSKLVCREPSTVIFYFDEMLTDGDVNTKKRMPDINNQIVYELEPGEYHIETFESYTFKFLKFIVLKGSCHLQDMYLREYAYPMNEMASFSSSNPKLNAIYQAAGQTFRQNAVDIFMDCPSRERAGWLCDSYFMAIMEKGFTGGSAVARNFYENYALPESFAFLPDGMIPMCYPADHNDGVFIPNWSLWFIIQIDDFAQRGGDPKLVRQLKPRISKLLDYFAGFENEDGLLEKLDSWIFVEWSHANSLVQDVNYPTNMLYSAALQSAARLYGNDGWQEKADLVRQKVLNQSWNGSFFVDNAIREADGNLRITANTTEVCQYYAFFFNIATPESHSGLWEKITTEFGPNRDERVVYPDVYRANVFIGNYLRMDILSRYGLQSQLLGEIQDYFYYMADLTGTLWEHDKNHASCNHGFASYLGHILYRDILGIKEIDHNRKEITIRFADIALDHCSGSIPVGHEAVKLNWRKTENQIDYSLYIPEGFRVIVENDTSLELKETESTTI